MLCPRRSSPRLGIPQAAEPAWGWELLEGRAERCVLAAAGSYLQASPGGAHRGVRGCGLACDLSKHVKISSNCFLIFLACDGLLGCYRLQGLRNVETLKKHSACGLSLRSVCMDMQSQPQRMWLVELNWRIHHVICSSAAE